MKTIKRHFLSGKQNTKESKNCQYITRKNKNKKKKTTYVIKCL